MNTSKIYDATNNTELKAALAECMNKAVDDWWHGLGDEVKKAIRMLGFSRSVVSSIMFFSDVGCTPSYFGNEYNDWVCAFKGKIDNVIKQNLENDFSMLSIIITYHRCMTKIYNETMVKIAPLGLSREIQEAAIQDLLSRNGDFQSYKKLAYEEIEDFRKDMLWKALDRIDEEGE